MLQAILHGKAGRIEQDGESISWRDAFKRREDLLTAVFFGRVPHLSDDALGAVLRFLLGDDNPIDPSTFDKLEPVFVKILQKNWLGVFLSLKNLSRGFAPTLRYPRIFF